MTNQCYVEDEVCEACGVAGEMGFIIKEGDEVAEVTIFATEQDLLQQTFEKNPVLLGITDEFQHH